MSNSRTLMWGLLALLACAGSPAIADSTELDGIFAGALRCETDFPDARNPADGERLRRLGAVAVDRAPGETLDLLYFFPRPLEIEGTQITAVTVRGSSGSIVMAQARGDMQVFVRRMQAKPHPRRLWALDGYGDVSARYARVMPLRPQVDDGTPPLLVIGPAPVPTSGTFRWGCRSFDG